ncbi:MAG: Maf family protein [Deltaproteobacteria bacterium]|jgi:septum formation protein|nr:Maf family protein [Deltaproteobacteria bacterium]
MPKTKTSPGPDIPEPLFVLASASPRRRELLAATGLTFSIAPTDVDESVGPNESPEELVGRLSFLKAKAGSEISPSLPVISADTVVALGERVFGKPENLTEAKAMLQSLSGQVHRVITGVSVIWAERQREKSLLVTSRIAFRKLTEGEIDFYLSLNESLDKAGAYAIQMGGGFLVDYLEGSYTNVVGLPLKETLAALAMVLGHDPLVKKPA